jgi:phage terminase small subunit
MARPSKPIRLVKGHRTKAEKEKREKEEKRLLTGTPFRENEDVASDPIAHKEFTRLKKIFKKIDKDDGLQENVINRYCKLHSECFFYAGQVEVKIAKLTELKNRFDANEIEFLAYMELDSKITSEILACDKKIMEKRKMMLDIEKENIMTIASALRSVPKKVEESKELDPMEKILRGG